jgi:CMP-N-acetylneuraminic acid synthetase
MDLRLLDAVDDHYIVAIIPARGGSKSVPKKNIRLIYGHPMIAYSIAAAKLSKQTQRTIVSTDSEEIAEISRRYGAEVPFMRPAEFAQDNSREARHTMVL